MSASLRTLRLWIAAGLVTTLATSAHGVHMRRAHDAAGVALRDARIALQRAETTRTVLVGDAGQLASIDLSRESFELALIEAVTMLVDSPGVSELQYRRVIDSPAFVPGTDAPDDSATPLRVALSFRSNHAVAFLQTLQALTVLTEKRPVHFSGCQLQRARRSLAASCAVDWLWWDAV